MREDLLWELTLWRARKAGVIQSKSKFGGLTKFGFESESLRTRNANVQGQEKIDVLALPFCSVLAFIVELDGTHPHWGGPSALLSSPIQMLSLLGVPCFPENMT